MHWSCELWLLMLSRSSMYSPLRFHWLRNKGVQVSVCFFTKYRVSEDSRAGKRLRLILVLRETNVESGPAESSTTTLIEGFLLWEWCLFSWISEVQYDCLKRQRGITQVKRWQLVIVSVWLKYMFHTASSQKFISVKFFLFFFLNERLLPVSPKVKAEHCDQNLSLRFTKELQLKCH